MSVSSIKEIDQGSIVSFRSKNPNDTTVWQGKLESVGTYRSIRSLMNTKAYNEAVRQTDPTVSEDVTVLTYFTITVDNNSSFPETKVFADEWIDPGSLNKLELGNFVTIKISDPLNNPQRIVSLLANAGYGARILPQ